MEKVATKRSLVLLGIVYGFIITIINFAGYLIASSGKMPIFQNEDFQIWINYINKHSILISFLSVLTFVIPAALCIGYTTVVKKENITRRLINIPLMYSCFGATGWILNFILEFGFLIFAKKEIDFSMKIILQTSFLNISQECTFIFTVAFLLLDAIHRKFVLPKFFPEGNLSKIKGSIKISNKFLFTVFFLSVCIFPIFFLFSTLYIFSLNENFTIDKNVYEVLSLIILFGIVMVIVFSNYFRSPLRQLTSATDKIKSSDYETRVSIVSRDDFGELADNFNDMAQSLSEKTKKILAIQDSVIRGMAVMVESRDNSTGGHINRTSDCVKVFVNRLRESPEYAFISDKFTQSMIKAAPMHDLGKIAVDDAILRKPGRFTPEEYEIMKTHSASGAKIVEQVLLEVDDLEFKQIAMNVAHYHHEKWDGSGYPEKISGEAIPFEARIMALADVFDALVSKRCYKDSMTYDQAFNIIKDSLGTHFDPKLGEAFIACRKDLEFLYNNY